MSAELTALASKLGDRYLIERELGRGGMGAVYLARDRRLDRPVALKVLPPEYATVPELRERFLRETRLAAGFSHPNIVPVFAIEDSENVLAFAMGLVEGESLAARVARDGPLARRDAVRLLQDVAYALAYAHGRGVVHRDIKPDNIMIERATGRALVMDFGIARSIAPVTSTPGLTRVGEVVGTPEYMSPEQAAGEPVDGRADLYSLGLVAWFALVGRNAVTGESTQRILVKQLTETIPPLASLRNDLPSTLSDVVDRCCAKEADDRYPNAEAVVEALEATQLATPDIPVSMRLLAPELSSVAARSILAVALLALGIGMIARDGNGNVFAIAIIVAATAWVGLVTSLREVRRLRATGYSVEEVQRLLRLTLAERDEERARRAMDVLLVRRRRRRVIIATSLLLSQGAILFWVVRSARAGANASFKGAVAMVTFFAALLACAAALAILSSSPFRRSLNERIFNRIWLGSFGNRLMRLAGGSKALGARKSATVSAPLAPSVIPAAAAATTPAQSIDAPSSLATVMRDVSALRARVEALEAKARS
jgi:eukaryotic-like serine/threonine-protein kinase